MNQLAEIFGWYGTIAILLAYFLNAFGVIEASSNLYLWLNITGALGAIAIGYKKKVWQSVTLNIIWFLIGIAAIVKVFI
jgi:hypothetical protein